MFDNVVLLVLGNDPELTHCLELFLTSVVYNTDTPNFEIQIFTDIHLWDPVIQTLNNMHIDSRFSIRISTDGKHWESPHLCQLQRFQAITAHMHNYKKVMYMDIDILVTLDLSELFDQATRPDTLYVCPERYIFEHHNAIQFGKQDYTSEQIQHFAKNKIYPFNSGQFMFLSSAIMFQHFQQAFRLHQENPCLTDQAILNYYFNSLGIVDYSVLCPRTTVIFPILDKPYTHHIIHFAGSYPIPKHVIMEKYLNHTLQKFVQPHEHPPPHSEPFSNIPL